MKKSEIRMFPYIVTGTTNRGVAMKAINQAFAAPGGFHARTANEVDVDGCSVTVTVDQTVAGEDLTVRFKDPKSGREIEVPKYQFR